MASKIVLAVLLCSLCATPAPLKIAFIGDSFTQGAVDTNFVGFAGRVSDSLEAQHHRWVSYTFPAAFESWPQVQAYQPDIIILELGIHIISGRDTTQDVQAAIAELLDRSLKITSRVVYVAIPWRGWGAENNEQAQQINAIIAQEAAQRSVPVANSWHDMEQCGLDCIGYDDSHPNATGHQIIADSVLEVLVRRVFIPVRF